MSLKTLRIQNNLTQAECAEYLEIPVRTYQYYEAHEEKCPLIKHKYILQKMKELGYTDETHGILSVEKIKEACSDVFPRYDIDCAYLFGSYAKGLATEISDVDLLISSDITGFAFYELVEALREALGKKIDVVQSSILNNNPALLLEILKDGIKIYG